MKSRASSLRNMILAALFVALVAVGGQISIPLTPAPITLQTLFLMLAGSILGARWGAASLLVFVALAAAGAPVLSGGKGGLAVLLGPTGGYVFSWPVAAFLIGWMVEKWGKGGQIKAWQLTVAHIVGGIILVHAIGFPWLLAATHMPLHEAFMGAFLIFLPGDLAKAFVATAVVKALYKAMPTLQMQK
ncbi:biotin transporter BioY [Thermoflavimicrobium dichotomicum]|uniref:Biotin transporter n=1 Tax=Thermoflavimicrobium dichotomicum TaxID=46223 RepID=A0A1I3MGP6_9BACL|nr:biotin transporter BioY [Thermoflavimicrobium dichotomicum]SFI96199.1 biotin transport system substrate-specific component [Thermoflavimicrobium dichotomicum]